MPFLLAVMFWHLWLFYIRFLFTSNLKWLMLRVKVPKENEKTPKAMEQIFSAAYSMYSHGLRFSEEYWDGIVEHWASFEIVGYSGGVSFYIRCVDRYRHLFESAIYAQYPDAEIDLVEDYTNLLPTVLPNKTYDLWGADVILARDDGYPIRTYAYWDAMRPEEKIDTMATLLEVLSKLREGEMIWYQTIIRVTKPTEDVWKKKGERLRDKLMGRKEATVTGGGPITFVVEFFRNLIIAPFSEPTWSITQKKDEEKVTIERLAPGERDVVKGIEDKIGKLGFETIIRWLYISRKEIFSPGMISGMTSAFRQFNTFNMNAFRLYKKTLPIARQPFTNQKKYYKKRQLYDRYRLRLYPPGNKFSILNVEELATIYHYPSIAVEAPMLRRVEAKKGEPPPSLPVE